MFIYFLLISLVYGLTSRNSCDNSSSKRYVNLKDFVHHDAVGVLQCRYWPFDLTILLASLNSARTAHFGVIPTIRQTSHVEINRSCWHVRMDVEINSECAVDPELIHISCDQVTCDHSASVAHSRGQV